MSKFVVEARFVSWLEGFLDGRNDISENDFSIIKKRLGQVTCTRVVCEGEDLKFEGLDEIIKRCGDKITGGAD